MPSVFIAKSSHPTADRSGEAPFRAPETPGPKRILGTLRLTYILGDLCHGGVVFPHAFAEEAVLWPALRRVLPDGDELTLRVEVEHQQINELVVRLEALEPGSVDRRTVLDRIVALLREDVRDEEDVLLPRLQQAMTPRQLRVLGVAWEAVRRIAPTRAHPIVARRPPGNVISALPLSLLDRWRDRVDQARFRRGIAPAPRLEMLSAGLARAARTVERLPGMRRGEHPATRRGTPRRLGAVVLAGAVGVATLLALAGRRHVRLT